ncbi:MAG: carboxypeptidase-like regulatory domain-containing protein, partial [Odoribacter sp.]|nr:carboxypeptidase-like regulatory domain-containing protein [Odoribacter sp.]
MQGQKVEIEYQPNHTIVLRPQRIPDGITSINISGKIVDASNNEPLIGASVVLKEQRGVGVVTDIDGNFRISVPEGGASALVISYVGYEGEELAINGNGDMKDLTIKMTPASVEMEGVVVTGMAPRKSESFTGSYVSVKGEELKKLSPNNLLQALQFFDPSFRIVENNSRGSDPNAMPEFQMRGNAQIGDFSNSSMNMLVGNYSNQPNMPLFVLD